MGAPAQGKGRTEVTSIADSASGGPSAHRLLALAGILTPAHVRLPSAHYTSPARKMPNADTAEDWGAAPGSLGPHSCRKGRLQVPLGSLGHKKGGEEKQVEEKEKKGVWAARQGEVEVGGSGENEGNDAGGPSMSDQPAGPQAPGRPSSAWVCSTEKGRGKGTLREGPAAGIGEPARVLVPSVGGIPG